jgi:hypothetical protein
MTHPGEGGLYTIRAYTPSYASDRVKRSPVPIQLTLEELLRDDKHQIRTTLYSMYQAYNRKRKGCQPPAITVKLIELTDETLH